MAFSMTDFFDPSIHQLLQFCRIITNVVRIVMTGLVDLGPFQFHFVLFSCMVHIIICGNWLSFSKWVVQNLQ